MPPTVINGNGLPLPASRRSSKDIPPSAPPAPPQSSTTTTNPPGSSDSRKRSAPADTSRKHSATFTVTSGSERVVHVYPDRTDRTSSGGSASVRSPASSGGSRSLSSDESWSELEYDDEEEEEIGPSDSASRARHPPSRRHTVEAPGVPRRRHSSRRESVIPEREEVPSRRHSSRRHHRSRHDDRHDSHSRHGRSTSTRVGSDESSSTVASADDYPYGHPGMPRPAYPPHRGYSQAPPHSHGGYPPSMASASAYHDPYGPPPHQALVRMQQDPFGYPRQPNPFSAHPQETNPFSPAT